MFTSSKQTLIASLAGATSALVVVALVEASGEPAVVQSMVESAQGQKTIHVEREVSVKYDDDRISQLERDLEAMREASNADPGAEVSATSTEDPVESELRARAYYEEISDAFEAELPDPTWSSTGAQYLEASLLELGARDDFAIEDVECKSTRCRARVSYVDQETASVKAGALAEAVLPGLNCAQTVTLSSLAADNAPHQAELHLDCSEQRAGHVAPIAADEIEDFENQGA